MNKLQDTGLLVARILMPILFIVAGYGKMGDAYAGTQQYMQAMGVPGFFLPLTILLEFGGGLAILFGFLTRTTALFTAGFTILTALIFHTNFAEGVNQLMFMKNLTIAGGFIVLAVAGPGGFINPDPGVKEVWPRVGIWLSCRDDFNCFSVSCSQVVFNKQAVFPDKLQKLFLHLVSLLIPGGISQERPINLTKRIHIAFPFGEFFLESYLV